MTEPKRKERICVMDGLKVWDIIPGELVRCRDCKWATPVDEPECLHLDAYWCAEWADDANRSYEENAGVWVHGDEFCSRGERVESWTESP